MTIYDSVITEIKENKKLKDSGKYIGIPYKFSTRLRKFIPVIEKGQSIGILAGTGVNSNNI